MVGFFVLAMSKDWLITRGSHLREVGYLHQRADDFKAALEAAKAEAAEYRAQVSILLGAKDQG